MAEMNQRPQWQDVNAVRHMVANIKTGNYDVYVGRPGPWGNPFKISRNADRNQVIRQHQAWLNAQIREGKITRETLAGLADAHLGCYCAPKACHGHTLARYALAAADGAAALETVMHEPILNFIATP